MNLGIEEIIEQLLMSVFILWLAYSFYMSKKILDYKADIAEYRGFERNMRKNSSVAKEFEKEIEEITQIIATKINITTEEVDKLIMCQNRLKAIKEEYIKYNNISEDITPTFLDIRMYLDKFKPKWESVE